MIYGNNNNIKIFGIYIMRFAYQSTITHYSKSKNCRNIFQTGHNAYFKDKYEQFWKYGKCIYENI